MQRTVTDSEGREGQAIPTENPEIALVLWDGGFKLNEIPVSELTFEKE